MVGSLLVKTNRALHLSERRLKKIRDRTVLHRVSSTCSSSFRRDDAVENDRANDDLVRRFPCFRGAKTPEDSAAGAGTRCGNLFSHITRAEFALFILSSIQESLYARARCRERTRI